MHARCMVCGEKREHFLKRNEVGINYNAIHRQGGGIELSKRHCDHKDEAGHLRGHTSLTFTSGHFA